MPYINGEYLGEEELREVAWEVISRLSVARLLEDCVEALVAAYQIDGELYLTDKEMIDDEDARDISMPMHTYINAVVEKEQEKENVDAIK